MSTEWARIAYQITERNRGPALPVDLLAAGRAEADVREILRVGKRCVVLTESREGHEHFIRFAHHRFQEYFAACHIHTARPEIDWLERLDAPRWQETMLSLILLGGEAGPVQALADSVATLTNLFRRKAVSEEADDAWDVLQGKEAALPDTEEALLADRVELCSRILRQGSEVPGVSDTLKPPFREAVQLLAEKRKSYLPGQDDERQPDPPGDRPHRNRAQTPQVPDPMGERPGPRPARERPCRESLGHGFRFRHPDGL